MSSETEIIRQVGGDHYARPGGRQHWDLMADLNVGYFPAVITKYVERHELKNGREDLEKALSYAEKNLATATTRLEGGGRHPAPGVREWMLVTEYCRQAGLGHQQTAIFCVALLEPDREVLLVELCALYLAESYGPKNEPRQPGTPADGGHHADPAERRVPRFYPPISADLSDSDKL